MKHVVKFHAGYDCIKFECRHNSPNCIPGEGGSHGCHGLNITFAVEGDKGSAVFKIYTGWLPQFKLKDNIGYRNIENWGRHMMPADLGYHSKTPTYEGQSIATNSCEFCDGQPCYYDGSGLNANDAMYALVNGGDEGLWKFMDQYYITVFEDGAYPVPVEYSKPLRVKESIK